MGAAATSFLGGGRLPKRAMRVGVRAWNWNAAALEASRAAASSSRRAGRAMVPDLWDCCGVVWSGR